MTFRFDVVTLFPELMEGYLAGSILGRAVSKGLVEIHFTNPREFTTDRHRTVDDRPFGGGPGMVMKVAPLGFCAAAGLPGPGASAAGASPFS